jgi:predicted nucleic acid-binding protein
MRYLLDTAVVVEGLRNQPSEAVEDWIGRHAGAGMAISVMSRVELYLARGLLAPGADHNAMFDWLEELNIIVENAVLPFDDASAAFCARLMTQAFASGCPAPLREAMLVGTAEAYGLVVAARPTPLLTLWGGPLVDPWR